MRPASAVRALATAGLAALLAGCQKAPEPPAARAVRPVKTIAILPSGEGLERTFSGAVRAGQEAQLAFRVGGKVERILVEVGDEVRAEELLAALDRRDYEIAVRNTESNLASAQAAARKSESGYQRAKALYENSNISKDDLEQAEAQRNSDRAQAEALQSQLDQAKAQLSDTELKAPFAGAVSKKEIEPFENVAAGQAILSLVDPRALEVRLGLPENLIARVRRGEKVSVALESFPGRAFAGTVSEVGVALDPTTGTYPLTVALEAPGAEVRPGMAAEVTLRFGFQGKRGIVVPTTALVEDIRTLERSVWVVEGGAARKRPVTIGELVADGVEIVEGLREGETVVVAGAHRLEEGQPVRPLSSPTDLPQRHKNTKEHQENP